MLKRLKKINDENLMKNIRSTTNKLDKLLHQAKESGIDVEMITWYNNGKRVDYTRPTGVRVNWIRK
ncbi:hypothetical protein LCGC14_1814860 [marine sediment metagenome]|uniref:Uncharacterized protein n=1 Tax=marine sediment metagenome TaxID=412755 RepID=A0A0F9H8S6_9ZZZZ